MKTNQSIISLGAIVAIVGFVFSGPVKTDNEGTNLSVKDVKRTAYNRLILPDNPFQDVANEISHQSSNDTQQQRFDDTA